MQPLRSITTLIAASGLALLIPAAGFAQTPEGFDNMTPEQRRDYVQGLSDEDRQAFRDQRRAQWDAMSAEEQRAARQRQSEHRNADREAMRQKWDSMSEEEREAARAQRMARKEKNREVWNNMSDEQKNAARQRAREHRDAYRQDGRGRDRQQRGGRGKRQQ